MSVTPWGGLELSGITIAQTSAVGPRHFLEAKTFRLRVRFLSLFSRRLVIKEISLINPNVVWPQDAEGKWRLPSSQDLPPSVASAKQAASVSQPQGESESVQMNPASVLISTPANLSSASQVPLNSKPPRGEPRLAVAPEVRRVSVKNGNFTFLDFVPTSAARWRFTATLRLEKFRCGTAFFWNNYVPSFAMNLTCWSFPRFLRALQPARSTAILPCNRKRRILRSRRA